MAVFGAPHYVVVGVRAAALSRDGFCRLVIAQAVSEVGDWASRVAVSLLVLEQTGSAALAAAAIALSLAPWVGLGQWLASLADGFDRRRILIAADTSRAVVFGLIAVVELPAAAVLALVFVAGCADPPFEATRSALIPELVPDEEYTAALGISTFVNQGGLLVGYASGGALAGSVDPRAALAVNSLTFVLSALVLRGLPADGHDGHGVRPPARADLAGALGVVTGDRWVGGALVLYAAAAFAAMVAEGVVVVVALDAEVPDGAVGLLAAAVPLGTILGTAATSAASGGARRLLMAAAMAVVAGGAGAAVLFATSGSWWLLVGGYAAIGLVFAASPPANAVAGRRVPPERRAAVFGVLQGVVLGAHAAGAAVGGLLAEATTPRTAVLCAGTGCVVIGVVAATVLTRTVAPLPPAFEP